MTHPIEVPAGGKRQVVDAGCEAAQLLAQHAGEHGDYAVNQVDGCPTVLRRFVQRRARPVARIGRLSHARNALEKRQSIGL